VEASYLNESDVIFVHVIWIVTGMHFDGICSMSDPSIVQDDSSNKHCYVLRLSSVEVQVQGFVTDSERKICHLYIKSNTDMGSDLGKGLRILLSSITDTKGLR
jgi:hypothetical protein